MAEPCIIPTCKPKPILKVFDKDYAGIALQLKELWVKGTAMSVPLTEISVELTINGFVANVESVLHFKNTESQPIEAVYEFPIDDQSAAYYFEARIEDRVIVAECQQKEQAKETYKDAIEQGYTATLIEEDENSSDIFRCLLGNLPAGVEAVIKFAYVIELPLTADGAVQFVLPTQLNPRYNPSLEKGGAEKPVDVPYVMPGGDQPYKFTFAAKVFNSGKILSVRSGSEKDEISVKLAEGDRQAEVSLAKSFVPDHDLSLQVLYEEALTPHVIIERGDAQKDGILTNDAVMLNFFPQLSESAYSNKHEFIFVIDRSGSMGGSRIESAKIALLVFLKSLPPGCYFNIIGFGSTFALLFTEGSREYSEETLRLASEYQSNLDAEFGGTEILEPLAAIYEKPPLSSHSRQILVLTDGEVSNTQHVIDLVRKNASNARLFSFGIGEGASTSLVKGIARAGRGKAEFVLQDDQITGLVMKTLKAAMQVSVTDLHLDWELGGSAKLIQVPRELPPLFAGDRLIVYAFNDGQQGVLDGKVHLKGKLGEKVLQFSLDVSSANNTSAFDKSLPIHRLAAKAEIKHLQDQDKEDGEKNKAAITVLSIAANVVSKYTSMVGVDFNSKKKVVDSMVQRQVPLMMSPFSAYGAPQRCMRGGPMIFSSPPMMMACSAPMPRMMYDAPPMMMACAGPPPPPMPGMMYDACELSSQGFADSVQYDAAVDCCEMAEAEVAVKEVVVGYISVVSLQTFNGSWKLDEKLAQLTTGLSLQQLVDAAPVQSHEVWATAVAIALLTSKFADNKDEWEMIVVKARNWLDSQPIEGGLSSDDVIQRAVQLLATV